jgi:hypothetical protein
MRGSQVELARWCRLVGTTVWPGCDPAVRLAIGDRSPILHQSVMRVGDSPLLPGSPTTPAPKREHPWWPCMAKRAGAWPRRR